MFSVASFYQSNALQTIDDEWFDFCAGSLNEQDIAEFEAQFDELFDEGFAMTIDCRNHQIISLPKAD